MMKMKRSLSKTATSFLATLLILLTNIGNAFARAGGGESFGDGGFDSGGGSIDFGGGSSGGGYYPISNGSGNSNDISGIVIVIIIIIVIVMLSRKRGKGLPSMTTGMETPSSPAHSSQTPAEIKTGLEALKKMDPKFDQQKFKTHTKKVFMAVQDGWTKQDQSVCRAFMAEDVYQSHQMQIDNMKSNKVRNVLENIVVGSTEIVRVDQGDEFDKIAVKVRASMKDYKVSTENGKLVEGTKAQTPPFTEYWIFIRKAGLKTKVKDGIFDRKCPNCGAPIQVSVSGECKYCDANVVNGDYDWVLSEIVQRSEWKEL